jgi:hypothetical protein
MSYKTKAESEQNGWTWYLMGDHVGELRLERPAAWKLFNGNRKEVVSVDVAGVLRAVSETEAVYAQQVTNVAHQAKQEAEAKKAAGE